MKKPELLAPAGSMEMLKAVIEAGADAVYLSGYMFGARTFAGNFSNEEIVEAISYAHLYGVKVYVTVNTLVFEDEIETCLNFIDFIHRNNIDAILVQDLGILDLVRKTYPNLEIHASTQMNIHNLDGALVLKKLGVKRIVLARETSLALIKEIKDKVSIDLETFIHGALCFSYSGQCLMSSLIGDRSGNRGSCAGCCRQQYKLSSDKKVLDEGYLISMKDLNTIELIPDLIEYGIDSLKIEGRTKRVEYAYLVTKLYRKAIDNYTELGKINISDEEKESLLEIYNREFTEGYINSKSDVVNKFRPNHIGVKIGTVLDQNNNIVRIKLLKDMNRLDGIRIVGSEDVGFTLTEIIVKGKKVDNAFSGDIIEVTVSDKVDKFSEVFRTSNYLQLKELQEAISKKERKVNVKVTGEIILGKHILLRMSDSYNTVEATSEYVVQASLNSVTSEYRIIEQLSKIGFSIYNIEEFDIKVDDDIFASIKVLNDLKRALVDKLNEKRLYSTKYKKESYSVELNDFKKEENINYCVNSISEYNLIKDKFIKYLFLNEALFSKINDVRKVLKLGNICDKYKSNDDLVLVGEIGALNKNKIFIADYSFNVTNSYALAFLHSMGSSMVTLSHELDDRRIGLIISNYINRYNKKPNVEVIVYGRELVMTSKYNLLDIYNLKKGYLIDKFNNKYPLLVENNLLKIYNYKVRDLKTDYFKIGVNNIRYNIID